MTLRTVLLSLQALLAAPEPDDPQDAVVARQYQVKCDYPEIFVYSMLMLFFYFIEIFMIYLLF